MATCEPCASDAPGAAAFYFSRGPGTFRVPRDLPKASRAKLVAALAAKGHGSGAVLLRGGAETMRYDSDHEPIFRQESYFAHLFGVKEADCWATIALPSGSATLYIPRLAPEYAIWMGEIKTPASFVQAYGVDEVRYVDELKEAVRALSASGPIHVLNGVNTDSGLNHAETLPTASGVPDGVGVEGGALYEIAAECRVVKSVEEVEAIEVKTTTI